MDQQRPPREPPHKQPHHGQHRQQRHLSQHPPIPGRQQRPHPHHYRNGSNQRRHPAHQHARDMRARTVIPQPLRRTHPHSLPVHWAGGDAAPESCRIPVSRWLLPRRPGLPRRTRRPGLPRRTRLSGRSAGHRWPPSTCTRTIRGQESLPMWRTRTPQRGTRPPSHRVRGGSTVRPLHSPAAYDHTQPGCFPPPPHR